MVDRQEGGTTTAKARISSGSVWLALSLGHGVVIAASSPFRMASVLRRCRAVVFDLFFSKHIETTRVESRIEPQLYGVVRWGGDGRHGSGRVVPANVLGKSANTAPAWATQEPGQEEQACDVAAPTHVVFFRFYGFFCDFSQHDIAN
ncbi:hypothetical protein CMUS01_10260 [Colletotrichum musicola]|uniref:Uncharacterized protein n=1 Tax=Colletotrichum musicola TaxID=2175873 RepID=A0A8H6K3W0_9PEZI|nr:hypothetical protein CMUS01_10260 [Colletotrichum musicola]